MIAVSSRAAGGEAPMRGQVAAPHGPSTQQLVSQLEAIVTQLADRQLEAAEGQRIQASLRALVDGSQGARSPGRSPQAPSAPRAVHSLGSVFQSCSPVMASILDAARRHATSALRPTVGLFGDKGTGKTELARGMHEVSGRTGAFVGVNAAELNGDNGIAMLVGCAGGAFTGVGSRAGVVEAANGGTLFLDEIGELDLAGQALLLKVIEDKRVTRRGATEPVQLDLQILVATNRDLLTEVEAGRFRADLFERIQVVLHIPPLSERPQDVGLLIDGFRRDMEKAQGKPIVIEADARPALEAEARDKSPRWIANTLISSLSANGRLITTASLRLAPWVQQRAPRDPQGLAGIALALEGIQGVLAGAIRGGAEAVEPARPQPQPAKRAAEEAARDAGAGASFGGRSSPDPEGGQSRRWSAKRRAADATRAARQAAEDLARFEAVREALAASGGVCSAAAERLGLGRTTLDLLIRRLWATLGLNPFPPHHPKAAPAM